MQISDFDYELPEELIAQSPAEKRDASRMLFADRKSHLVTDTSFGSFPDHLRKGDVIVLNDTKVFPARLFGESETGAKIELFLVNEIGEKIWEVLARPGRRLKPGKQIRFGTSLSAEVLEKRDDGKVLVEFASEGDFDDVLDEIGKTPLPPYIKRETGSLDEDRARYQTVYAKKRGAIAAPTAGLHFTPEILSKITKRGAEITQITLHVGYGTFEPVRVEDLSEHKVMAESFEIENEAREILNNAKAAGNRIIAIGTTTTRALETSFSKHGEFVSGKQTADLTITPGYRFTATDGLLTNFHLPKSSLLVLVSTFGGYEFMMDAYRHAVKERYRFYSYGDCMLII
ncbi:MAG: tRNA preQ1(34) S-adenosylmethionine ribosyltransferase-isomerase QueA [Pyrinomonadaceae bacterium]